MYPKPNLLCQGRDGNNIIGASEREDNVRKVNKWNEQVKRGRPEKDRKGSEGIRSMEFIFKFNCPYRVMYKFVTWKEAGKNFRIPVFPAELFLCINIYFVLRTQNFSVERNEYLNTYLE